MTCAALLRDPYFAPLFAHVWPLFWPYLILQLRRIAREFRTGDALSIQARVSRRGHISWQQVERPRPPDWRERLRSRARWPRESAAAPFSLQADCYPEACVPGQPILAGRPVCRRQLYPDTS
jgi:hypothetical protein